MKSHLIAGTSMLALGIAIGWVAKPAPKGEATDITAEARKTPLPRPGSSPSDAENPSPSNVRERRNERGNPKAKSHDSTVDFTPEQQKEMEEGRRKMMERMVGSRRSEFNKRIDKLTEELSLNDSQRDSLARWVEARLKKFEDLDLADPASHRESISLTKGLNNAGLENVLAASLSEEQKTALGTLQEREMKNRADNRALKNLTKLQSSVDIRPEQRDAVYEALAVEAEKNERAAKPDSQDTSFFHDSFGIDIDPYDLGFHEATSDESPDGEIDSADTARKGRKILETLQKRIDARVEALRGVLDERQLEQYRADLQEKGMGPYQMFSD